MRRLVPLLLTILVCACSPEARELGPTTPQTPPDGDADPRIASYQGNFYQLAQGGRYFDWYGCATCHREGASGVLNLADDQWRYGSGFAQVFRAIVQHHGRLAYGSKVPVEQLWQLTAYVRDLPLHHSEKRRRQALDARAEPQGKVWQGPQ